MSGELAPLRIWLEADYDYGRFGAWLLDLPGAFLWAADRELAVSQASSAAAWYRDWLARHGERIELTWDRPVVVEEVPATIVDGYERNALFEDDRRPVEAEELEAAIRRLGYLRADLLDLADRVVVFEGRRGRIAEIDAERPANERNETGRERTSEEVLRHVAKAEMWLTSRLDPAARFAGADRASDLWVLLDATGIWSTIELRRIYAADPAAARVDGKGEAWTLRKVLRRLLYHAIDHYRELDLRLARAEGRVDRLRFVGEPLTAVDPLVRLLRAVGWDRRTRDPQRLWQAVSGSHQMVSAWDGDELVGFTREVGDGFYTAVVAMVIVDPRWQGLGIADRLIRMIVDGRDDVRFSLGAAPGLKPFYERFGFVSDDSAMIRRPAGR
jgi:GNAT superfamily N-acetyltransferase